MLVVGSSGGGLQSFRVLINEGKLELVLWESQGDTGYSSIVVGTAVVPQGTWTHVAVTYDGTTATTYINGVQDATVNLSHPVPGLYNLFNAGNIEDGSLPLTGILDELNLENATWTADQVAALAGNG